MFSHFAAIALCTLAIWHESAGGVAASRILRSAHDLFLAGDDVDTFIVKISRTCPSCTSFDDIGSAGKTWVACTDEWTEAIIGFANTPGHEHISLAVTARACESTMDQDQDQDQDRDRFQ